MDQPLIEEENNHPPAEPMEAEVKVEENEPMPKEEAPIKVEIKEGVNGYVE